MLARGLREQGYAVDLARDGETAGSFLRVYEYAVAVIDWRMPAAVRPGPGPAARDGRQGSVPGTPC